MWTVAYDTQYAMVDREDDISIGVKSTAILFGQYDRLVIAVLQILALIALAWVGWITAMKLAYFVSLGVVCILFIHQHYTIWHRDRDACFRAFLNNHYVGMVIAAGIALSYWF